MSDATSLLELLLVFMIGAHFVPRYRRTMRAVWKVIIVMCVMAASAAAKPALEPHDFGALKVQMPRGWSFTADAAKGMAVAQQDPKRKDAAQLVVVVVTANAPTEDQLLDGIAGQVAQSLKIVHRGTAPGGTGKQLVADGVVDNIKVRLGAIAVAASGGAVVGVLIAKGGEFDGLGGLDLVISVMASLKGTGATAPTATAPTKGSSSGLPGGRYACQRMQFTVNSPPTYVPTGISFDLDGNGGYNAPSFTGGPGTVTLDGNVMTFHGGSMNGWHGFTGSISSGPFVRIRLKDPTAIATTLLLGDGMCYLQRH
jgi:hypothetical protein